MLDKYAGDALYAALVYAVLSFFWNKPKRIRVAVAVLLLFGLELFQITGVPARMVRNPNPAISVTGRLLGTQFGWLDLIAYALGIAAVAWAAVLPPDRTPRSYS